MIIVNIIVGILSYLVIGGIISPIICFLLGYIWKELIKLDIWNYDEDCFCYCVEKYCVEKKHIDMLICIALIWPLFIIGLIGHTIFLILVKITIKSNTVGIKFLKSKIITKLLILFVISFIFIFSIYKPFDIKIKFTKTTENSNFIPFTEKEQIAYEIRILERKKKELEKKL